MAAKKASLYHNPRDSYYRDHTISNNVYAALILTISIYV